MTEAAPVIDTCKTCRAWRRGDRVYDSNEWREDGIAGTCRLEPSRFTHIDSNGSMVFSQPVTHEDDWCTHYASAGAGIMMTRADGGMPAADESKESFYKWVERCREWESSPIGKAFSKFEYAHAAYWRSEGTESGSPKELTDLGKACREAQNEFMIQLRGWK